MGARANCQVHTIRPIRTTRRPSWLTRPSGSSAVAGGKATTAGSSGSAACVCARRSNFTKTIPQRGHSIAPAGTSAAHFGHWVSGATPLFLRNCLRNRPRACGNLRAVGFHAQRPCAVRFVAVKGCRQPEFRVSRARRKVVLRVHLVSVKRERLERGLVGGLSGHGDSASKSAVRVFLEREFEPSRTTGRLPGSRPHAYELFAG